MRVMLTGCDGQVGKLLKRDLASEVELFSFNKKELDITNEENVFECIERVLPDVIINAAAYTAVDNAEDERDLAFRVNRDGPCLLSKAANTIDAAIVHLSTDYVYDGEKDTLYTESDLVNPQNEYGKSKLAGEECIIENCPKHLIVRTSWVFGEHSNNFVRSMLRLGMDRDQLGIVSDQLGAPTYAGDIVICIQKIIEKINSNASINWGVYHYSGAPYVSWFEFAGEIFKQAGIEGVIEQLPLLKPIKTEDYPTKASRPKNSRLNSDKIIKEFDVLPSDWKKALENIKKYI